jgi:hypothetical protein
MAVTPHNHEVARVFVSPIQDCFHGMGVNDDSSPVQLIAQNTICQAIQVIFQMFVFTVSELLISRKGGIFQVKRQLIEGGVQNCDASI